MVEREPPLVTLPVPQLMQVAHEYEVAKRFDDAERLLGHVLKAHPQHAPALHLMGLIAFQAGQYDHAL